MQHSICSSEGGRNALYESVVVLIVEDDRELADMLHEALVVAGYAAHVATSSQTAAHEAAMLGADAVVLDLMMPGIDGWDVARELRRQPQTAAIAIIVLTAFHRVADAAREIGTPYALGKPFDLEVLNAMLTHALGTTPQGTAA